MDAYSIEKSMEEVFKKSINKMKIGKASKHHRIIEEMIKLLRTREINKCKIPLISFGKKRKYQKIYINICTLWKSVTSRPCGYKNSLDEYVHKNYIRTSSKITEEFLRKGLGQGGVFISTLFYMNNTVKNEGSAKKSTRSCRVWWYPNVRLLMI